MSALSGIQVLQDNSQSTLIQFSDRPAKLFLTTGHKMTPAPFSGYPVSTIHVSDFFQQVARNTDNCLHYLLPDMRDSIITNWLRSAKKFPHIFVKTNKFKNLFICYGLSHYQLTAWHSYFCLLSTVYVVLY